MPESLVAYWWTLAATAYGGGFLMFALVEMFVPRRHWSVSTVVRWSNNFASFALSALLVNLLLPTLSVGFALIVSQRNWGLFNQIDIPKLWILVISLLAIDLVRYVEHRSLHSIPVLWRCHRMHHADRDFDVATGLRSHPFEAIYSALVRIMVIAALGIPPAAVIVAELVLVATNFFIHANMCLPVQVEQVLRRVVVTPDFHRIHHSTEIHESNSNYANVLSVWDYLFGTYVSEPQDGHMHMRIGLSGFMHSKHMRLHWMLVNPFLADPCDAQRAASGRLQPADDAASVTATAKTSLAQQSSNA